MYKQAGFTLVELMIAVTVVAIIAAVAIPSYNDYLTRGRIVQATNGLSDALVRAEQFFQDNRTYPNGCSTTPPSAIQIRVAALQDFTISCAGGPTTFTATATGKAGMPMAGFVYTINQSGTRATSGVKTGWTLPSGNSCWVRKRDGSC